MKKFDIPAYYRSGITGRIKELRKETDPRKKNFEPTLLDFGPVRFYIARHFGFCYGVENAIELSYKAVEENPGKRIFLLSQMIHNPMVNADLVEKGIRFIMDTEGAQLIEWDKITADDIVMVPAFGTTLEIMKLLENKGIEVQKYNTTCPFVERVWTKSGKLGEDGYTIIIHGKHKHEETRATFSHSQHEAPSLIVKDIEETNILCEMIAGKRTEDEFYKRFEDRMSAGFSFKDDLKRIGVVNQTTMLASETQEIADRLKTVMIEIYGQGSYKNHFADTRDTLCYATNDNQQATYGLLEKPADLAIVVGGYNSSNTSHIVELCEGKFPTYFISNEEEIFDTTTIQHFNFRKQEMSITKGFLPEKEVIDIILTSGASCPDTLVDKVLQRLLSFFEGTKSIELVMKEFEA